MNLITESCIFNIQQSNPTPYFYTSLLCNEEKNNNTKIKQANEINLFPVGRLSQKAMLQCVLICFTVKKSLILRNIIFLVFTTTTSHIRMLCISISSKIKRKKERKQNLCLLFNV